MGRGKMEVPALLVLRAATVLHGAARLVRPVLQPFARWPLLSRYPAALLERLVARGAKVEPAALARGDRHMRSSP